jgi:hypothetical protein
MKYDVKQGTRFTSMFANWNQELKSQQPCVTFNSYMWTLTTKPNRCRIDASSSSTLIPAHLPQCPTGGVKHQAVQRCGRIDLAAVPEHFHIVTHRLVQVIYGLHVCSCMVSQAGQYEQCSVDAHGNCEKNVCAQALALLHLCGDEVQQAPLPLCQSG